MKCHYKKSRQGHSRKCGGGVIRRVTGGLAKRFGLQRHWVGAGFIVCLIVNPPLAFFLFLLGWFWVDHPGKIESWWSQAKSFGGTGAPRMATAGGPASQNGYDGTEERDENRFSERMEDTDPFFQDLKERFDDLEMRAGNMEEHVASEEFELRRAFRKMQDDG